jgi:ubiquinone/menaquinone biosynthesis C-methylase UbiE
MAPMMEPSAQTIASLVGAEHGGPLRVLDIAAGHGAFGIAIARRNSQSEIVAVDSPAVLEVALERAKAAGVQSRYRTRPGDAFQVPFGTDYHVALVTNFLHHFDAPTCVTLLRKVAAALVPGGQVAVLEFVPNDDRVSPPMAAGFSLTMLAGTPSGDAYTMRELTDMLVQAGFREPAAHALWEMPQTVIVART